MDISIDSCIAQLRRNTLKVTPRRLAVITMLLAERRYFSPYEVYERLLNTDCSSGLPSVYRILQEFSAIGLVTEIERSDRQQYYFLCKESSGAHHHHFICRICCRVEPIKKCFFDSVKKHIETELDAQVESHIFQLEGICASCRNH
ncbi:transcriptional repressor [bacterium]|nr:transcriptional repressor [bacterium]MCP5461663.1 transcriptional repressor [bacterium]